jgi:hypothetical protein
MDSGQWLHIVYVNAYQAIFTTSRIEQKKKDNSVGFVLVFPVNGELL